MTDQATAAALEKVFEKGAAIETVIERPDGGKEVLIPTGFKPHTIPPLEPPLPRIRQAVQFYDAASFIAYVNRFKLPHTQVFAMPGHLATKLQNGQRPVGASVTAFLDYHKGHDGSVEPDRLAHIARYFPVYAKEWELWSPGGLFAQVEFAEFIEENRKDIVKPAAMDLLALVKTFKSTKKISFDSSVYNQDGTVKLNYAEDTEKAGTGVDVPAQLLLGIPVFFGGGRYEVPVFMRYKLGEGAVRFQLKPDRPEYIEQAAFDEILAKVEAEVGIKPYVGEARI